MNKLGSRWIAALVTVAGLGAVSGARADWVFDGSVAGVSSTVSGGTGAPTLTMSGVSTCVVNGCAGTTFAANALADHGGTNRFGMYSYSSVAGAPDPVDSGSPYHAFDNSGKVEGMVLSFSSSVVLTNIGIGYKGCAGTGCTADADVSIFRFVGGPGLAAPTAGVGGGLSTAAMLAAGWELVGNYGDLDVDTTPTPFSSINDKDGAGSGVAGITGGKGSSWWLIAAYNSGFGSTASNGGTLSGGDDFFKLYAVAGSAGACTYGGKACGDTSKTPEPASLALVAAGLVGALSVRRRRIQKATVAAA